MIGKTIGRYHILQKLGEGGMAIVYQAHDKHLDTDVALKIIRKERMLLDNTGHLLQRFETEAKRVARLSNPNIIPIIDYGKYQNTPYLVMKFIPGGTLKERLALGRPIPYQDAARLLIPIVRALSYAHQQGIVHRDVKPGNILLTETGEPMLSDFGIAMMVLEQDAELAHDPSAILGTPEYMAPEQALNQQVDHRADIYALGCIYYEMVTGQLPFSADTPLEVLSQQIHQPPLPARHYVPSLPEMVQRVLARALEKSPSDRFQTMEDFGIALKLLAQRESQPATNNRTMPLADDESDTQLLPPEEAAPGWLALLTDRRRIAVALSVAFIILLAIMARGVGLAMLKENNGTALPVAQLTAGAPVGITSTLPNPVSPQVAVTSTPAASPTPTATNTAAPTETPAPAEPVGTAQVTETSEAIEATADIVPVSPQGSEKMQAAVQALFDEGVLPESEGRYIRLADFEESWAQIGWYQWWFTGYELTDFVVSAQTSWESASSTADWFNAGCGFVFREQDPQNHYMIYLGLDGFVYMRGYIEGKFRELGSAYFDRVPNEKGEAEVMLVASGDQIYYYVEGKRVLRRRGAELLSGNLSYTLVSGTNRPFGTRCTITDVELWQPIIGE